MLKLVSKKRKFITLIITFSFIQRILNLLLHIFLNVQPFSLLSRYWRSFFCFFIIQVWTTAWTSLTDGKKNLSTPLSISETTRNLTGLNPSCERVQNNLEFILLIVSPCLLTAVRSYIVLMIKNFPIFKLYYAGALFESSKHIAVEVKINHHSFLQKFICEWILLLTKKLCADFLCF